MKKMQFKTQIMTTVDMPYFIAKSEADIKALGNAIPGKISMLYTNWSAETTHKLAGLHARGVRVFIKSTEIKTARFPRPYIVNATPEELKEVRRLTTINNVKNCQRFVTEAFKVITKGYGVDPRRTVDVGGDYPHYRLSIVDKRFPKTNSFQQALQGIEEGLAYLVAPSKALDDIENKVRHKLAIYADQLDYHKHTVVNTVAPFDKETDERTYNYVRTDIYVDEYSIKHERKTWCTGTAYNRERFYAENTDEVFTWKDAPRTKGNNCSLVYFTDVQDTVSTQKLNEAQEVLAWLEEHDMLDMNAYHCPNCGHTATTYNGCGHCGYELPKEAVSEFNNGRITREELQNMSVEDINSMFTNEDTAVGYQDWQNIDEDEDPYGLLDDVELY